MRIELILFSALAHAALTPIIQQLSDYVNTELQQLTNIAAPLTRPPSFNHPSIYHASVEQRPVHLEVYKYTSTLTSTIKYFLIDVQYDLRVLETKNIAHQLEFMPYFDRYSAITYSIGSEIDKLKEEIERVTTASKQDDRIDLELNARMRRMEILRSGRSESYSSDGNLISEQYDAAFVSQGLSIVSSNWFKLVHQILSETTSLAPLKHHPVLFDFLLDASSIHAHQIQIDATIKASSAQAHPLSESTLQAMSLLILHMTRSRENLVREAGTREFVMGKEFAKRVDRLTKEWTRRYDMANQMLFNLWKRVDVDLSHIDRVGRNFDSTMRKWSLNIEHLQQLVRS